MSANTARSTALYYSEISRTNPVCDPQEERRLIHRWQHHKDRTARDTLLTGHLRYVVTVARRYSKDPERLPDLIAAGNVGLLTALDRYDLTRHPATRFLTYAGSWIYKEIADEDYATSSLVHVPTHRQKAHRKQAKAFRKAVAEHGPSSEKVKAMNPGAPEGATIPIDVLIQAQDEDILYTARSYDQLKTDSALRKAIDMLNGREQTVINLYFGAKDEPRNVSQIAALLDVCTERVRQIKMNAMAQLKEHLAKNSITQSADAY